MRRPAKADDALIERIRNLLDDEKTIQATEVLRRSKAWGSTRSKSAMSELVKKLRPCVKCEPIVRFDGLLWSEPGPPPRKSSPSPPWRMSDIPSPYSQSSPPLCTLHPAF